MFLRRIGPEPNSSGLPCSGCRACPDIWELEDGDFAIIGTDISEIVLSALPPSVGVAPGERVVRLPRKLLVAAKRDIPDRI